MNDPEVERLIKKESPQEKDNLFLSYTIYIFPSLMIALALSLFAYLALALTSTVPFLNYGFFGWAGAFLFAVLLSVLFLMGLLRAAVKKEKTGALFTTVASVIWTIWMLPVSLLVAKILPLRLGILLPPALEWLAAGFIFFLLLMFFSAASSELLISGLRRVAGLLVPGISSKEEGDKIYNLIFDTFIHRNYPCYVVTDEEREEDKIVQRIKGNAYSDFATGCGLIISDCDHAVAVTDGFEFKGVKKPGTTLTGFADEPLRTLDLRPQLRTFTPRAFTKDGILVEALVFAPFQIDRGGQQIEIGKPFPFRTPSAIQAVQAQRMEHPGTAEPTTQRSWDELPELIGTPILQSILSRYTFDELYDPFKEQDELPRIRIAKELLAELKKKLAEVGIELIGGGISNIKPVDERVIEERIRSWQAEWQRRTLVMQAQSHREWLQQVEKARADAQAELILSLGRRLAELEPASGLTPEQLVSQFLSTLEQMMMQPGLRGRFSPYIRGELQQLREEL